MKRLAQILTALLSSCSFAMATETVSNTFVEAPRVSQSQQVIQATNPQLIGGSPTQQLNAGGNRAYGLGTSSSANSRTCLVPIFFGFVPWRDAECTDADNARLVGEVAGQKAALEYLCGNPDTRVAVESQGHVCKIPIRSQHRGPVFSTGAEGCKYPGYCN